MLRSPRSDACPRPALGLVLVLVLVLVLGLVLALASAPAALAQGDQGKPAKEVMLPWNPLADAKAGEWTALEVSQAVGGESDKETEAEKVVKVEGGKAYVLDLDVPAEFAEEATDALSTGALSFGDLVEIGGDALVKGFAAADETIEHRGRKFACTKITGEIIEGTAQRATFTIWLSKEVPVRGMVRMDVKLVEGGTTVDIHGELTGFGAEAGKATWGEVPQIEPPLDVPPMPPPGPPGPPGPTPPGPTPPGPKPPGSESPEGGPKPPGKSGGPGAEPDPAPPKGGGGK